MNLDHEKSEREDSARQYLLSWLLHQHSLKPLMIEYNPLEYPMIMTTTCTLIY